MIKVHLTLCTPWRQREERTYSPWRPLYILTLARFVECNRPVWFYKWTRPPYTKQQKVDPVYRQTVAAHVCFTLPHHTRRLHIGVSRRKAPVQHLACKRQLRQSTFEQLMKQISKRFAVCEQFKGLLADRNLTTGWCWWRFQVFWDIMPYIPVNSYWLSGWVSCLHVHIVHSSWTTHKMETGSLYANKSIRHSQNTGVFNRNPVKFSCTRLITRHFRLTSQHVIPCRTIHRGTHQLIFITLYQTLTSVFRSKFRSWSVDLHLSDWTIQMWMSDGTDYSRK
jgi:hypothetical protein